MLRSCLNQVITIWKKVSNQFLGQKIDPKFMVLHSWKNLQDLEKLKKKKKKFLQLIFADKIFKTVWKWENCFKVNGSGDILNSCDFMGNCFSQ